MGRHPGPCFSKTDPDSERLEPAPRAPLKKLAACGLPGSFSVPAPVPRGAERGSEDLCTESELLWRWGRTCHYDTSLAVSASVSVRPWVLLPTSAPTLPRSEPHMLP